MEWKGKVEMLVWGWFPRAKGQLSDSFFLYTRTFIYQRLTVVLTFDSLAQHLFSLLPLHGLHLLFHWYLVTDILALLCRDTSVAEPGMVSVVAMTLFSSPSGQCWFLHLPTCKWAPGQLQGKVALDFSKAPENKDADKSFTSGDRSREYRQTCAE